MGGWRKGEVNMAYGIGVTSGGRTYGFFGFVEEGGHCDRMTSDRSVGVNRY